MKVKLLEKQKLYRESLSVVVLQELMVSFASC